MYTWAKMLYVCVRSCTVIFVGKLHFFVKSIYDFASKGEYLTSVLLVYRN